MPRFINNARVTPDGKHWGAYSATSALPGTAAGIATNELTIGDVASVGGMLYLCTSTAYPATWAEVLSDGGTVEALTLSGDLTVANVIASADVTAVDVTASGDIAGDTVTATGALVSDETCDVSGDLTVGGLAIITGGIVGTTLGRVTNIPIGGVAYASIGTDGVSVAGTVYFSEVYLPANKTITGIGVLNGTVVGTDKVIVALYSSTGAALLANSALTGALSAGADAFQQVAFTAPYAAVGPARYWIALQVEGTTAAHQRIAASTYLNLADSVVGVFGTLPATITPATSVGADEGPIGYLY